MIQAILLGLLFLLVAQIALASTFSLFLRTCVFVLVGTGAFLILRPSAANDLAHWFGVGRGADLLLYVAVCTGAIIMVRLYLRTRVLELREAELVREIAIIRYGMSLRRSPEPEVRDRAPASLPEKNA